MSISKSLPNEVAILDNLAKQEIMASNRLANKVGKSSNLAYAASARAYMRARIHCASRCWLLRCLMRCSLCADVTCMAKLAVADLGF
jgi:hypothetical protein